MFELSDRAWLWIAAALYLLGFVAGTVALLREKSQSRGWMYGIIAVGFVVQTFGLYLRGLAVKGCPLGNNFEIFQFTAWSATSLFLFVGAAFRLSLLGYFTSCLAAAVTLVSLAVPQWDAVKRVGAFGHNSWIEFHAALAIFSYGVFGLLALTSLMYLLQHYSLRSQRLSGFFAFLPSIRELDVISTRLLAFGTFLLTASLAVGSVYWLRNTDSVNKAKLFVTIGVWIAYAVTWGLRKSNLLVARRLAWCCLVLFGIALLSLQPVNSSRNTNATPTLSK